MSRNRIGGKELLSARPFGRETIFTNLELKNLIIPLVIEQFLMISVGMLDTMMISGLGEEAVSGVSLIDMVNNVLIVLFSALATGGAVITAQYLGAQKEKQACRSAKQLLMLAVAFSACVAAAAFGFREAIVTLCFGSITDGVRGNAVLYLAVSAVSYPFLGLYNSCAALFRAVGNSKISMEMSLLMNVLNLAGNALAIYVLKWGVFGAALSTLLARMVSALWMFVLICNPKEPVYVNVTSSWKPDLALIRKILYIGIPNGLENCFFQLGRVLVVGMIALFGTVQIAANAVANNIDLMGCIPGQAMSLAMITVVGRCVGSGKEEQTVYYIKKLMALSVALMILADSLTFLCLPLALKLYHLSPQTNQLAIILISIHNGSAMLLWPFSFVLPNALRAANDVKYTMAVSIFSMAAFRIAFSYILGIQFGMGAVGIFLAMLLDWIFRIIFFLGRFLSGKWKRLAGFSRQKEEGTLF